MTKFEAAKMLGTSMSRGNGRKTIIGETLETIVPMQIAIVRPAEEFSGGNLNSIIGKITLNWPDAPNTYTKKHIYFRGPSGTA